MTKLITDIFLKECVLIIQLIFHSLLDFKFWRSGISFSYKNDVFIEKLGVERTRDSTLFMYGSRCSADNIILTGLKGFYFGGSFYKLKVYGNAFSSGYWLNLASFYALDSSGNNATSADKANFEAHVSGGGSASNDIRVSTTGNIVFNSNTYTAIPIKSEGFEMTTQGTLPRPTLTVANLDGAITALIKTVNNVQRATNPSQTALFNGNDLTGTTVRRIRTLRKYLMVNLMLIQMQGMLIKLLQ